MTHYFYNLSPGVVRMPVPMPPMALVFLSLSLGAMMAFAGWARLIGGALLLAPAIWLWGHAPKVVMHWSVSGDVYIANPDGMVERLSLTDGDGMAPLRFSEVSDATACDDEVCVYPSFSGLRVRTNGQPDKSKEDTEQATSQLTVAIEASAQADSDLAFSWTDVREAGGITVYAKDGHLNIVRIQNCTERRWRRCSSDDILAPRSGAIAYFDRVIRNGE